MLDPMTPVWVALALAVLAVALAVLVARSLRWGAVCSRCAWRHRTLSLERARRAAAGHGREDGHEVNLYRRD